MKRELALCVSLGLLLPSTADAATLNWHSSAVQYDYNGSAPSVAMYWNSNLDVGPIEVHQGLGDNLWYHPLQSNGGFGPSDWYTTGYGPTVALGDPDNVVELHMGDQSNNPPLWYDLGNYDGWTSAGQVGQTGWNPSLAVVGGWSSFFLPLAVEVHQGGIGVGPLWMNVGYPTVDNNGVWTSIPTWVPVQYQSSGAKPVAAILASTWQNEYLIVEIHQSQLGYSKLWSSAGTLVLHPGGGYTWTTYNFDQFTSGNNASVAMCTDGDSNIWVVEVNEGSNGSLWSHTGQFTNWKEGTPSFSWIAGSDQNYDSGYAPKVSCLLQPIPSQSGAPGHGMEVHQGGAGNTKLWYHEFDVQ